MTFKELIQKYTWTEVEDNLVNLYSDTAKSTSAYMDVFVKLHNIAPTKTDMKILVHMQSDILDEDPPFPIVSGKNGKLNRETSTDIEITEDNQEWANLETVYAIQFEPWSEWLGMEICDESYELFTELEIICHCLWEMTFCGFDENEIKEQKDMLTQRAKECKEEDSDNVISISDNVKMHRDVMDVLTEGMDDDEFIEFSEAMEKIRENLVQKKKEQDENTD